MSSYIRLLCGAAVDQATIEIVYPRSISGPEPYEDDDVYSHLRNDAIFSPDDFLCSLFFWCELGVGSRSITSLLSIFKLQPQSHA